MKKYTEKLLVGFLAASMLAGCSSGKTITLDLSTGKQEGTYTGDMSDDIPNGKGKFSAKEAKGEFWTYEGDFKDGHFDGDGTITYSNGTKEIGTFKDDQIVPMTGDQIKDLASDTDKFVDHVISSKGLVFTDPTLSDDQYFVQIDPIQNDAVNQSSPYWLYVDTKDLDPKTNDYIEYTGIVKGTGTGDNAFGTELSAPEISVTEYKKIDYAQALAPAKESKEVNQTIEEQGLKVTLEKIEFADKETRFYLTAINNSNAKIDLSIYDAEALQDGHQFETQDNYEANYPQLSYRILPGAKTSGVLVFPPLKNEALSLVIDAYSEDYTIMMNPITFDVK